MSAAAPQALVAVVQGARRIVVKVGSSLVTNEGRGVDAEAIGNWSRQLAALAVVRAYVGLRQGEVWRDIRAAFEAEGLQLSDEER